MAPSKKASPSCPAHNLHTSVSPHVQMLASASSSLKTELEVDTLSEDESPVVLVIQIGLYWFARKKQLEKNLSLRTLHGVVG